MTQPTTQCLHELFSEQARLTPEAIAVSHGNARMTYADLDRRANQVAHHLQTLGIGPDDIVALHLHRSPELIMGLIGILKAGGAYLPLDPSHPEERISTICADAGVRVVVTQASFADRHVARHLAVVALDRDWPAVSQAPTTAPSSAVGGGNLAYVIYTSGSTGRPKGVMLEHSSVANYVAWASDAYRIETGSGAIVNTSVAFDATVTSLIVPLLSGRSVELLPEGEEELPALGRALCDRGGYSLLKLTPAQLDGLQKISPEAVRSGAAHAIVVGGEALSAASVEAWRMTAPDVRIFNEYGPTETVVGCSVYEIDVSTARSGFIPIGKAMSQATLHVLDENQQTVPPGGIGELYIGGPGVARGYLRQPSLTAERFVPDPNGRGGRLYRSGDLVRCLEDGNLEFVGRIDHQVKLRGFRVELGEIEAVLLDFPGVRQAVVTAPKDAAGEQNLVAYLVPENASALSTADLKAHALRTLPAYMVPSIFVVVNDMPLTSNGKVDRKALLVPTFKGEHAAPVTELEQALAAIWQEVLQRDLVGVNDDFFALGGHSLRAMRILAKIQRTFSVKISVQAFFDMPTVGMLARHVEMLRTAAAV